MGRGQCLNIAPPPYSRINFLCLKREWRLERDLLRPLGNDPYINRIKRRTRNQWTILQLETVETTLSILRTMRMKVTLSISSCLTFRRLIMDRTRFRIQLNFTQVNWRRARFKTLPDTLARTRRTSFPKSRSIKRGHSTVGNSQDWCLQSWEGPTRWLARPKRARWVYFLYLLIEQSFQDMNLRRFGSREPQRGLPFSLRPYTHSWEFKKN